MRIRVIVICLCLMAFGKVRADDELLKLLGNKAVEYVGTCRVDTRGAVVFTEQETVGVVECVVGSEPTNSGIKFILIWNRGKLHRLVRLPSSTPTKQEVIWRNPDTLI